jgi:hypothetical protein
MDTRTLPAKNNHIAEQIQAEEKKYQQALKTEEFAILKLMKMRIKQLKKFLQSSREITENISN